MVLLRIRRLVQIFDPFYVFLFETCFMCSDYMASVVSERNVGALRRWKGADTATPKYFDIDFEAFYIQP